MATYCTKGDRFEKRTISPMALKNSIGTATGRGLSPGLWGSCPVQELKNNPQSGHFFFDDFIDGITIAANTNTAAASALGTTGSWTGCTAATAGSTVSTLATNYQGAVVLSSTTDNEDAIICYPKGGHVAGMYKFSSDTRLWMEARIQVNSIADTIAQLFVGFAEEGLVATTTLLAINEAGIADKDYVAFYRAYADGDKLDAVWNTASGGSSPVTAQADAATLVATTWTKVGMYCDGTTVWFYQNGTVIGKDLIADTDFPDGEEMAFYAALMCGAAGSDATMTLDWVALAQAYSLVDPIW